MKPNYIYLIQLREFIKSGENVYKIGRTNQDNFKRFYQYPKNSKILFQIMCCSEVNLPQLEKNILFQLEKKYILRKDIGREYFEGNLMNMMDDIYDIIKSQRPPN